MIEILGEVGPFIGGISLLFGAIIAASSLILFNRRQVEDQWVDRFRTLYAEFWDDDQTAEVRKWILNDLVYAEVEFAFAERNKIEECDVPREIHNILEDMDQFCAVLVRIKSFPESRMSTSQRKLWRKLLGDDFWVKKIGRKKEMAIYVAKFWPELGVQPKQSQ